MDVGLGASQASQRGSVECTARHEKLGCEAVGPDFLQVPDGISTEVEANLPVNPDVVCLMEAPVSKLMSGCEALAGWTLSRIYPDQLKVGIPVEEPGDVLGGPPPFPASFCPDRVSELTQSASGGTRLSSN
jgi:hypothetical protein